MEVGHAFKGEPVVQELPQDYGEAVGIHLVVVVLLLPVPQSDRAVQLPKKKKKKNHDDNNNNSNSDHHRCRR